MPEEIHPPSPECSTPTGRELIAKGIKVETDVLILDKRALVPLSLEESALVPKERKCSLSKGFDGAARVGLPRMGI